MSTPGLNGAHDLGGVAESSKVELVDPPLDYWQKSIHALLVILSSTKPSPIITTDELRRAVEALEPAAYGSWGYYDKWGVAMGQLLLEKGLITNDELMAEVEGDSNNRGRETPPVCFKPGDVVRVKNELSRLRWRRPHLRCPGYIYGSVGRIVTHVGNFSDPFLLAFSGTGPKQPLFIVRVGMGQLWPLYGEEGREGGKAGAGAEATTAGDTDFATGADTGDSVELEVYQDWLEVATEEQLRGNTHSQAGGGSDDGPSRDRAPSHGRDHSHSHDHAHDHGHEHAARGETEAVAVVREGEVTAGRVVGEALMRLLYSKAEAEAEAEAGEEGLPPAVAAPVDVLPVARNAHLLHGLVTPTAVRRTVEALEGAGVKLLGAHLVARSWVDEGFKQRLLTDAASAAAEIGVPSSNPNAPTVLRVVANTPDTHNVIVCTLCSCYPVPLLGLSPAWYKSRSYRARMVREPRAVLREFGTVLPRGTRVVVHDSTADCRYLVLPMRPEGTDGLTEEQLRAVVTRDSMVGVAVL